LDIPEHCFAPQGDFTHDKLIALANALRRADAITAISPFVRSQLNRLLALPATVIWNPIKGVSPDKRLAGDRPYAFRVLIAGRARDPNKRQTTLGVPALIAAGFEEHEVAVVGGEWPGWGTDLGVVSDAVLNDLYNSVDLVMHPSLNEGLGLSPLEAMVCGAVPVLTYDCSTFGDIQFFPQHWGCYPSVTSLGYRLRALVDNPWLLAAERQHCLECSEGIVEQFGADAVARRIVEVTRKVMSPVSAT
jgi:glycosyltransferase involved in cell wall biosynthesis